MKYSLCPKAWGGYGQLSCRVSCGTIFSSHSVVLSYMTRGKNSTDFIYCKVDEIPVHVCVRVKKQKSRVPRLSHQNCHTITLTRNNKLSQQQRWKYRTADGQLQPAESGLSMPYINTILYPSTILSVSYYGTIYDGIRQSFGKWPRPHQAAC